MDLPIAGAVQRALGFPSWLAGLVWLVKHEAAEHFLLHLSAAKRGAVTPIPLGRAGARLLLWTSPLAGDLCGGPAETGQGEKPPH